VDKYLASYGFRWRPEIKIEFNPNNADVSSAPPDKECVYASHGAGTRVKASNDKVYSQCFDFLWGLPSQL